MGHKYNQPVIEQQKDFKYFLYDLSDSIRSKSFLDYVKDLRNLMINNILSFLKFPFDFMNM